MDAATIAATAAIITAISTPLVAVFLGVRLSSVHSELKTLNEGTVGTFTADNETRRIELTPHDERTPTEQRHLDTAPPAEPPQGPSR
jgi:hypothetical protein